MEQTLRQQSFMAKHRLDAVVRLRERAEKQALEQLGEAVGVVVAAEARLREAREAAARDGRQAAVAEVWELQEAAHERARRHVDACVTALAEARTREEQARAAHLKAYKDAEVIRRVARARVQEAFLAEEKREAKALDELSSVQFHRRNTE